MLDVKLIALDRVRHPNFIAHGHDFVPKQLRIARGVDNTRPDIFKKLAQKLATQDKTRPSHGLMLPSPCRITAALLLVTGVGSKTGDQQARVAVRPQSRVNFKQIAFTGFNVQPGDNFSNQGGIHNRSLLLGILVNKHKVQIASVAELFAAQLAVGNDGDLRLPGWGWMFILKTCPAPLDGDAKHRFGQRAQVISHLLDRKNTFHVPGQRAKNFCMVGTAQQIQTSFFVVFSCTPQ